MVVRDATNVTHLLYYGFTGNLWPVEIFSARPRSLLNNLFTLATQQGKDLALQAEVTSVIMPQLISTQLKKKNA